MSSQNGNGAVRAHKHEKLPGNRIVVCPHCDDEMKAKRLPRHIEVHHPEAIEETATAVAG